MKLLETYPTIIAQRGDKYTLNSNITKKLTEEELNYLEQQHSGYPKNEQLYRELIDTNDTCACGEPVKFVNFSQGYKELCPKCKRVESQKAMAITRDKQKNAVGTILTDEAVIEWVNSQVLDSDKWTQDARANNTAVYYTVRLVQEKNKYGTWMQGLYAVVNGIYSNECKGCSKPTRFAGYNTGYQTFCGNMKCSTSDVEVQQRVRDSYNKTLASQNVGRTTYANYVLYTDPIEAQRKYVDMGFGTLEEFDKVVPVLDWCDNTDYKQRRYYYDNEITEQKVCHCGNKIEGYKYNYCSIGCVNRSEEVRSKIVDTSKERYGVEHYSKTEERNTRVEATNMEKFGVPHAAQSEQCKLKAVATNVERYGCEHPIGSTTIATGYQWKEYKYPSGKIIKVQGYEPQCLNDMVMKYGEDDLQFGTELAVKVKYELNGPRTYFPDGLIVSTNTVIEVKSEWTLGLGLVDGVLNAKRQACLDAGYKFQLRVYNKKGDWYEYKFKQ